MGKPGGLPSMGSHRVGHDWSDLAVAAAIHLQSPVCDYTASWGCYTIKSCVCICACPIHRRELGILEPSKISITTMPSTPAPSLSSSDFAKYRHIQESPLFCGTDNSFTQYSCFPRHFYFTLLVSSPYLHTSVVVSFNSICFSLASQGIIIVALYSQYSFNCLCISFLLTS